MSSEQAEVATATIQSASTFRRSDPFNWPAMGRADLMSLSKLDEAKDIVQTRTMANRYRKRDFSDNLNSKDIEGKSQKRLQTIRCISKSMGSQNRKQAWLVSELRRARSRPQNVALRIEQTRVQPIQLRYQRLATQRKSVQVNSRAIQSASATLQTPVFLVLCARAKQIYPRPNEYRWH